MNRSSPNRLASTKSRCRSVIAAAVALLASQVTAAHAADAAVPSVVTQCQDAWYDCAPPPRVEVDRWHPVKRDAACTSGQAQTCAPKTLARREAPRACPTLDGAPACGL